MIYKLYLKSLEEFKIQPIYKDLIELYQIYTNKAAINEKRTAIKSSGFREDLGYWSSGEYSCYYEYTVNFYNGGIDRGYKDGSFCVLGFLALEV